MLVWEGAGSCKHAFGCFGLILCKLHWERNRRHVARAGQDRTSRCDGARVVASPSAQKGKGDVPLVARRSSLVVSRDRIGNGNGPLRRHHSLARWIRCDGLPSTQSLLRTTAHRRPSIRPFFSRRLRSTVRPSPRGHCNAARTSRDCSAPGPVPVPVLYTSYKACLLVLPAPAPTHAVKQRFLLCSLVDCCPNRQVIAPKCVSIIPTRTVRSLALPVETCREAHPERAAPSLRKRDRGMASGIACLRPPQTPRGTRTYSGPRHVRQPCNNTLRYGPTVTCRGFSCTIPTLVERDARRLFHRARQDRWRWLNGLLTENSAARCLLPYTRTHACCTRTSTCTVLDILVSN